MKNELRWCKQKHALQLVTCTEHTVNAIVATVIYGADRASIVQCSVPPLVPWLYLHKAANDPCRQNLAPGKAGQRHFGCHGFIDRHKTGPNNEFSGMTLNSKSEPFRMYNHKQETQLYQVSHALFSSMGIWHLTQIPGTWEHWHTRVHTSMNLPDHPVSLPTSLSWH